MPYCATCRMEYRDDRATCTDCGATLVAGPMPDRTFDEEEWRVLLRARDEERADIVQGMLRAQGIPCEVISKALSEMPVPAIAFSSYFECWVPRTAETEARALLKEAEGVEPCPSCGHLPDAGEAACEYCGAPIGPGSDAGRNA